MGRPATTTRPRVPLPIDWRCGATLVDDRRRPGRDGAGLLHCLEAHRVAADIGRDRFAPDHRADLAREVGAGRVREVIASSEAWVQIKDADVLAIDEEVDVERTTVAERACESLTDLEDGGVGDRDGPIGMAPRPCAVCV